MKLDYIVKAIDENKQIKEILKSDLKISKRLFITLKNKNSIFLNDMLVPAFRQVKIGDKITVSLDYEEDNSNIISKQMELDIVYEDEWLLIVNKQAGIPVHPSISHYEDSLSSGVKYHFDKIGLKKKIRPVNRIDRNTSGLVAFAKNEYIQECLIRQMKTGDFGKEYIAIVEGWFENKLKKRNY